MNRRRFLKDTAGGLAVVGATVGGVALPLPMIVRVPPFRDTVGTLHVSTVELPYVAGAPPVFYRGGRFETVVFGPGWDDSEILERYTDLQAARTGHAHWVALAERYPSVDALTDVACSIPE